MKTLEDLHDYTFNKYVFSDSFHLPASINDLRSFTEKLCKEIFQKISQESCCRSPTGTSLSPFFCESGPTLHSKSMNPTKSTMKNSPIGLDSLSKTFNIINIVGKGSSFYIWFLVVVLCWFQGTLERFSKWRTSLTKESLLSSKWGSTQEKIWRRFFRKLKICPK